MAKLDAFAAIVEEHDVQFPVKKVSPFLANGATLVRQAADSNGNATTVQAGYSTVTSFTATNNSAGTAVQLSSLACSMVEIFAPTGNAGFQVAIGGSNAKAASGSEVGVMIISGGSAKFYVSNANLLYFDVVTSGDKISYNVYS